MKVPLYGCVCNLLILTAAHLCAQSVAAALTLQQRLDISKHKRSIQSRMEYNDNSIYSRSSSEIAESVYNKLYKEILLEKPKVDLMLIIDSSSNMGLPAFLTARRFFAKFISMMPLEKFQDGSIQAAMLNFALSEFSSEAVFDFNWSGGKYREIVRRTVKKVNYQDGYENHGTAALAWADHYFQNSTRANDPNTTRVILYATNGFITDDDIYGVQSTRRVATFLKEESNITMFTLVPGTNVNRPTIRSLSSEPVTDHIIPVVNIHAVQSITEDIKEHKRRAHRHSSS